MVLYIAASLADESTTCDGRIQLRNRLNPWRNARCD
jgi:hypothetical protein